MAVFRREPSRFCTHQLKTCRDVSSRSTLTSNSVVRTIVFDVQPPALAYADGQPNLDSAPKWCGALRGLGHAHLGWALCRKDIANLRRLKISSQTRLAQLVGKGSRDCCEAPPVRMFHLHHETFRIDSLCYYFGCGRCGSLQETNPSNRGGSRRSRSARPSVANFAWDVIRIRSTRNPRQPSEAARKPLGVAPSANLKEAGRARLGR
jgi:hypothetical protein